MKKIFLVLAMAASLLGVNVQAQVKSVAAAKSAVEKAAKDVANPKKNTKADPWIKYGKAILDSRTAITGSVWAGMTMQELQILGAALKPISEEQVVVAGEAMNKFVYADKNLYFNANGQLQIIEVTVPVVENDLGLAFEAYTKAAELDAAGKKTKDIVTGLDNVTKAFNEAAYNAYYLGNNKEASILFEQAATASATAPYSTLDKDAIYNAAWTAWSASELDRAKTLFQKGIDEGYAGADGEAYAKLADIAVKQGNVAASKDYLEAGFKKHPQSQSILVGLINYYMTSGENTDRLFELIGEAKKNEPENASLYYVEGQIHEKLGHGEEAVNSYRESTTVNPNYEFGYIGEGIYFYNKAVDLQTKASEELDDAKYMALIGEFEVALKSCIAPFEKAFEVSNDNEVKLSVAEYLKNVYFRFRTENADYQAKYDKYAAFTAGE